VKTHQTTVRVRYEDADPMGFLHHSKYLSYFEIGRTEMYRAAGGNYRQLEESGRFVVVVRAEIRYRRPARYDDVVTVRTTLKKITAAKIIHAYEMVLDEQSLATATVTLALVDRKGQAQRIPEWMRELI